MFTKNIVLLGLMVSLPSHAGPVPNTDGKPLIFGNTYVSTGANAKLYGDSVATTYFVAGAGSIIEGNIKTGAAITTGATARVTGNITAGTAITLGATTVLDGSVCFSTDFTLGAGAMTNGEDCVEDGTPFTPNDVATAKAFFKSLTPPNILDQNHLNATIPNDLTLSLYDDFTPYSDGDTIVYNATSLTTAAGITLTLDGSYDWVFNITDMLSLGAGTKVVLAPGSTGSVTWNVGGYASIGAQAEIIGTIFAHTYISTGMGAKVTAASAPSVSSSPSQSYCGGLFSATSYVTIGASSTVSCEYNAPISYSVGDTGPGGGIVYYVGPGGFTGFEVAPMDSDTSIWGCIDIINDDNAVNFIMGGGSENTNAIIARCPGASAALSASIQDAGGFDDWYLPNSVEMRNLMARLEYLGDIGMAGPIPKKYATSSYKIKQGNFAPPGPIKYWIVATSETGIMGVETLFTEEVQTSQCYYNGNYCEQLTSVIGETQFSVRAIRAF
jgi:hypothetical protein